jgi:hypothetical protein
MHVESVVAREVINHMVNMKDFPGYQFILDEGAAKGIREVLLDLAVVRFGEPTEKQENRLGAIEDLERLKRMARGVLTAKNWDALLRTK